MNNLRKDIEVAINAHSAENGSDTSDFVLAKYLTASLAAFDEAVNSRSQWCGVHSFDLNIKGKAEVVAEEQSDVPESDISDIVSVQPLVSDTGKIFYYAYEDDGPLHLLRFESDVVTPNARGGDVIEWRNVLDMLSYRIPLLVVGTAVPASERVPNLRNQVALNSRRGRANFMIVNKHGFDWLRTDHLIPLVPSEPRWTTKRPSFVGEYDGMKVYYDNSITAQIIGYRGVDAIDSGVVVAEYEGYHCVKLVNPSYYIRFNV